MKISTTEIRHDRAVKRHQTPGWVAICALISLLTIQVFGQAPALLWSTNVGATLFAIDANTNLYASTGGTVITLNGDGVPLQTNLICPRPGIALRDPAGDYFFAGLLPSHSLAQNTFFDPQDFGGVVLSNMAVYLVKYSAVGTLLWATNLGPSSVVNNAIGVADFARDDEGSLIVIFNYALGSASRFQTSAKFDSNGSQVWASTVSTPLSPAVTGVRLTLSSPTNLYRLTYYSNPSALLERLDGSGAPTLIAFWSSPFGFSNPVLPQVILNSAGDLYNVEGNPNVNLTKRAPNGTVHWSVNTVTTQRGVGPDQHGGVHVASDTTNNLSRYDYDGNLAWTRSLPAKCLSVLLDPNGNRFLSLSGGIIARLEAEAPPEPPFIVTGPQTQIVALGSNATFSVTATGTASLRYQWRKDGTNLVVLSATNYTISIVTTNDVGAYDVVVTNLYGSVTSAPPVALLISPSFLSPFTGTVGLWGQEATLSVSAWGSGTLTYQWYIAGQLISGATNSTLVFPSLQINDGGAYSVVVASPYGSITNTPAELVVNPANITLGLYAGMSKLFRNVPIITQERMSPG